MNFIKFIESATPYLLMFFTLATSLLVWFYNLIEKRINARVEEIKSLHEELAKVKQFRSDDLREISRISTELRMIKEYQEKGFMELRALIVDKMENLKELFQAQIKTR